MTKQILITGTPRSGTHNVVAYYQDKGFECFHEEANIFADIIVDFRQSIPLINFPSTIYSDYIPFHLVRHPLKTIQSLTDLCATLGFRDWLFSECDLELETTPFDLATKYWLSTFIGLRSRNIPILFAEHFPVMTTHTPMKYAPLWNLYQQSYQKAALDMVVNIAITLGYKTTLE
jgi:hypothetical protein